MTGAAEETKYQYNGKELNEDFGLNWHDYGARWYDASIARWMVVDALAEDPNQIDKSPYAYTWNNPINLTDPDGNCPNCVIGGVVGGLTDYGIQVIENFIQGKRGIKVFTEVDGKSILVSAGSGALGVGIIGKIKKARRLIKTTKLKVGLEMNTDAGLNVAQQITTKGEVDLTETIIAAGTGTILRGKAQEAVKNAAEKKGKQLALEVKTAQRKAKNSAKNSKRQGKIDAKQAVADAKANELRLHNATMRRNNIISGSVSAGAVVKTTKLDKKAGEDEN